MKKTILIPKPSVIPMNLRYLCVMAEVLSTPDVEYNGILITKSLAIDDDNRLTRNTRDSFVVVAVAEDNQAEVKGADGFMRKVRPGDIIVPITQIEYKLDHKKGTGRKMPVYAYPYFTEEGQDFHFVDQYEVLGIIPDSVDLQFISNTTDDGQEIPEEGYING